MKKKIRDLTDEEFEAIKRTSVGKRKGICQVVRFNKVTTITFKELKDIFNKEVEIPTPHILDKKEHKYLREIVKPYIESTFDFRKSGLDGGYEYIEFHYSIGDGRYGSTNFLPFKAGTMYKGMKLGEPYSFADLELDKEWKE